jgi:hypothetical protein
MRKSVVLSLLLVLGVAFVVQAQDEVIERPADVKNPKIDNWKAASFDMYDKIREIKKQDEESEDFDAAAELGTLTGDLVVLLGKSALMFKEVKSAPKIKLLKYTKSVKDSTKALKWCKDYANSVLGEDAVVEEEEG